MSGYHPGITHFFTFFAVNLLNQFVNVTFAMSCVSLRRNFAEASLIANATMTFLSLSCGYFIQADSMPVYVRWIKYVSFVYWGFAALTSNRSSSVPTSNCSFVRKADIEIEFNDNFFDCPYGGEQDPSCTVYTGNYVMDQLGIPRNYVTTGCLALVGFILFYLLTSWLILQFLPVRLTFSKQVRTSEKSEGIAESVARAKRAEQRTSNVTIRVRDLRLWLEKRRGGKRRHVDVLQGITVDFEPGKLNVIMGPSGYPTPFFPRRY